MNKITLFISQVVFFLCSTLVVSAQSTLNKDDINLEKAFTNKDTAAAIHILESWSKESKRKKEVAHNDNERLVYDVYARFMDNILTGKLAGSNDYYLNNSRYVFLQTAINYCIANESANANVINQLVDTAILDYNGFGLEKLQSYVNSFDGENCTINQFHAYLNKASLKNDTKRTIFYDDKKRKCVTDFLGFERGRGSIIYHESNEIREKKIEFFNSILGINKNLEIEYRRPFVSEIIFDKGKNIAIVIYILNEATYWAFYDMSKIRRLDYFAKSILISRS